MKNQLGKIVALSMLIVTSMALIGCDGDGGEVVVIDDGTGYGYATIQNDSFDDIILDSDMFGQIYLPPGSGVDLDVGSYIDSILVFINGSYYDEIYVQSGDVIIFD